MVIRLSVSSDQQNSRSAWVFVQSHQGLVHFVHSIHIAPDKVLFFSNENC